MNPILGRLIDPSLRAEMLAFLRGQAAQDPNIILLDQAQMPVQTEKDYDDLSHVNTAAQVRFSVFMSGRLEDFLNNPPTTAQVAH
jgi:hypothetical protein